MNERCVFYMCCPLEVVSEMKVKRIEDATSCYTVFSPTMYAKKVWAIGFVAKIISKLVPEMMEIVSSRGAGGALNLRLGLGESSVAPQLSPFRF